MVYIYKEYKHIFDTPAKMEQETVVVNKIMELLNRNKYDNIYEFINKNKTYQDFLKNNELENVVKHFGNTLNEQDFKNIQNEMVKLTEKKKSFEKENIKTTNIDGKQYNSYDGQDKTFFLDNSHSDMSIERQMDELQTTEEKFQTSDSKQNTENMMKELENNKKEALNLKYLNQIDINTLNDKEKEIFQIVTNYQLDMQNPIRVDIEKEVIVDEFNNIMRIQKNNGEFSIISDGAKENTSITNEETTKEAITNEGTQKGKAFQKALTPSTIYSDNN